MPTCSSAGCDGPVSSTRTISSPARWRTTLASSTSPRAGPRRRASAGRHDRVGVKQPLPPAPSPKRRGGGSQLPVSGGKTRPLFPFCPPSPLRGGGRGEGFVPRLQVGGLPVSDVSEILVTGAAGGVGRTVCRILRNAGL